MINISQEPKPAVFRRFIALFLCAGDLDLELVGCLCVGEISQDGRGMQCRKSVKNKLFIIHNESVNVQMSFLSCQWNAAQSAVKTPLMHVCNACRCWYLHVCSEEGGRIYIIVVVFSHQPQHAVCAAADTDSTGSVSGLPGQSSVYTAVCEYEEQTAVWCSLMSGADRIIVHF